MIKRPILLILIFTSTLSYGQVLDGGDSGVQAALGNAQVEGSPLANFFSKRTPMMDILHALVKDDDGLTRTYVGAEVGSAYENDTFLPGKVYYGEEELGDVYYRLNAYNNEVELKKTLLDDEKQLALVKNPEVRIVEDTRELVFTNFSDKKGNEHEGYLTLLQKGDDYTLYRRVYKKFTEPRPAANSMVNAIPSRFTDYIEYYFKAEDSKSIRELELHKKRTAQLFPSAEQGAIQNYMKKNKPNPDSETDVLSLFNFIDSL